jgi:hypothetical protein
MTRSEKIRATKKRNIARRTQWALRQIRKHQPKNLLETSQLCMRLIHVGGGAFRESYRIAGTTLLIKFPIVDNPDTRPDDSDGKYHTRAEVRKIRALKKFPSLSKHLPPVYYYNSKDGVIVTKYFKKATEGEWICCVGPMLSGVIKELTGVVLEDLFGDNVRMHENGERLMIVDLGY